MLRVAVYYEGASLGRNDGNPLFITSLLKRAQHHCDVLAKRNQNGSLLRYFPCDPAKDKQGQALAKRMMDEHGGIQCEHIRPHGDLKPYGEFDLNLWVDWGEDGLKGILPYEPIIPKDNLIYWASDTHLGFDYRLSVARKADVAFCAQHRAVEEMEAKGVKTTWLPHAFEPLAYPKFNLASQKHDICFVGHVNSDNRMDMLDRAFREFPSFYFGQKRFEKASRKFAESKIVLNNAMVDDINMRVFETLGSGNLLLTDRIPTIERFFNDKEDLLLYNNLDEMVELAREYLSKADERKQIAMSGHEKALTNHTFYHRFITMLDTIKAKKPLKETVYG